MDIIPKPIQKLPRLQSILLYLSIALLLAAISIWLVLAGAVKKSGDSLGKLEETLRQEKTAEELNLEKDVLAWQKKINDFSYLLSQHLYPSLALDSLGQIAHPKSWFKKVALDVLSSKVTLSGQTQSFITLDQQLSILEADPLIKNFTLSSFSIKDKEKVDFSIDFNIDPEIFKRK